MASDDGTPRGVQSLAFNPDNHTHCVLKAFNTFVEQYEFRYAAQYPIPPKHAIDNEVAVWKSEHENAEPTQAQRRTLLDSWVSKDKVRRMLGFFASSRFQQDWKAAKTAADTEPTWDTFLTRMRNYYKPTENRIIRNFEFRQLAQKSGENFSAFCNRVFRKSSF